MRVMIHRLLTIILIGLGAFGQTAYGFIDNNNKTIHSTDWKNKWLIINYWADWCEPCAKEVVELNRFYHQKPTNVMLIGVNPSNLPVPVLKAAILKMHIDFPVLLSNPQRELTLPQLEVIPTTFIINPQGKLVKKLYGPQTAEGLRAAIR